MDLKNQFVITISREIGSGGRTVGRILSEKLDTRYCEKAQIKALEKMFHLSIDEIEELKGKKKHWLSDFLHFFSPAPSPSAFGKSDTSAEGYQAEITTEDIYRAESTILQELAAESSCVIAGRSGFFVFKDHPNHLDVFIIAPESQRIQRVMKKQGLDEKAAAELVRKIDEERENYIQRFTGTSRYDARNYDLVINAEGHTEEQVADIILSYIEK